MKKLNEIVKKDHACINCIYFEELPTQKRQDNRIGACKANPPTPAPDYSESKLGVWPLVLGTFWCGMFGNINEDSKEKIEIIKNE